MLHLAEPIQQQAWPFLSISTASKREQASPKNGSRSLQVIEVRKAWHVGGGVAQLELCYWK
jgi:hypothetical protein